MSEFITGKALVEQAYSIDEIADLCNKGKLIAYSPSTKKNIIPSSQCKKKTYYDLSFSYSYDKDASNNKYQHIEYVLFSEELVNNYRIEEISMNESTDKLKSMDPYKAIETRYKKESNCNNEEYIKLSTLIKLNENSYKNKYIKDNNEIIIIDGKKFYKYKKNESIIGIGLKFIFYKNEISDFDTELNITFALKINSIEELKFYDFKVHFNGKRYDRDLSISPATEYFTRCLDFWFCKIEASKINSWTKLNNIYEKEDNFKEYIKYFSLNAIQYLDSSDNELDLSNEDMFIFNYDACKKYFYAGWILEDFEFRSWFDYKIKSFLYKNYDKINNDKLEYNEDDPCSFLITVWENLLNSDAKLKENERVIIEAYILVLKGNTLKYITNKLFPKQEKKFSAIVNRFKDTVFYTAGLLPIKTNYKDFPNWKYTKNKDLLLARNGTPYVYFSVEKACYSDHIIRAAMKEEVNRKYIQFSLQQSIMSVVVDSVSLATWSASLWNAQTIPWPSSDEQQRIASFLDTQCAIIDAIIEKTRSSIEEYKKLKQAVITQAVTKGIRPGRKMKDSGIEWIGNYPSDWTIIKIKWILNERNERSENGEEEPLSMSQKFGLLPTKEMDIVPNMASSFIGAKLCYQNDLVFNKLKAHLGVFAVSQYDGLVSPDYAVYYANNNANLKYLEYLFKTPQYIGEFRKKSTGVGAGLTRLYTAELYSIYCALPPCDEQAELVAYLNEKIMKMDELIDKKERLISELEKYKKSIIFVYVTGKKEVPA